MDNSNTHSSRGRPGIIINPPTESNLNVHHIPEEEQASYDEDYDPNKTYISDSQYWQRQSSSHHEDDLASIKEVTHTLSAKFSGSQAVRTQPSEGEDVD